MPTRRDLANAIRVLSMDAVERAKSGHPGMPMGMADIAEVLWNDFLKHNPTNPHWHNRDRFILSNGHGCMLQYALLHLSGHKVSIDDIKNFRQLHSKTPGHPEYGDTPGVETTTGPLGQGLAQGIGMAIAEKHLATEFNEQGHNMVDHHTYVFAGDGCLMEGISHEVCSLAGTLGLGKLIVFYDSNDISIDGHVSAWFTDNTAKRFDAYHWQVIEDVDGHDAESVRAAIMKAREDTSRPTIIICRTVIGWGAPNAAGSASCHGAPLGKSEISRARKQLEWKHPAFEIPDDIYYAWDAKSRGQELETAWRMQFSDYQKAYPAKAKELTRRFNGELPENWASTAKQFVADTQKNNKDVATRKASLQCITKFIDTMPELFGGSADLSGSNCTLWKNATLFSKSEANGNYLHYGVREFGMTAIMCGMALHGGFIPFGGTFLVFSDYARNAVRLAAMMKLRLVLVYSHDSIGLGEDGPTHQPVEHAAMLRLTPNLHVWRPCDLVETAVAWKHAVESHKAPSALLLSRQTLPAQQRNENTLENVARGGYTLVDCDGEPEAIIIATGSEISLAVAAANALAEKNKRVRVVSMPCVEVFEKQDAAYQAAVLPPHVRARVAVEAGISDYWRKFVGLDGKVIGMNTFGISAPAKDAFKNFGFTEENVIAAVESVLTN